MSTRIELKGYTLSHPLERIRGGPCMLQISAVWNADGQEYCTPGLAQIRDGQELTSAVLEVAIQEALTFSQNCLERLLGVGELIAGQQAQAVLRTILTRRTSEIRAHLLHKAGVEEQSLEQDSSEAHQRQADDLCAVLGIGQISLKGTNVLEAAAMINELQFVVKNITKVGD